MRLALFVWVDHACMHRHSHWSTFFKFIYLSAFLSIYLLFILPICCSLIPSVPKQIMQADTSEICQCFARCPPLEWILHHARFCTFLARMRFIILKRQRETSDLILLCFHPLWFWEYFLSWACKVSRLQSVWQQITIYRFAYSGLGFGPGTQNKWGRCAPFHVNLYSMKENKVGVCSCKK